MDFSGSKRKAKKGSAILLAFGFAILLSGIVVAYLDLTYYFTLHYRHRINRYITFNIAEAGIHKMAWYLENTAPDLSTNGSWRGTATEALGSYNYRGAVGDLFLEGPYIDASSAAGANAASRAMDGSLNNYWRSSGNVPQWLRFNLLVNSGATTYRVYLSRIRLLLGTGTLAQFPRNYLIQTSNDGTTWTTRVTVTNNDLTDVNHTFTPVQANYIRIYVTTTQGGSTLPVNIGEVEIYGAVVPATVTSANAVDNSLATNWSASIPVSFTLTFPTGSNYSLDKIRMRSSVAAGFPTTYTLDVYSSGSWTNGVAYTQTGTVPDVTATFNALQTNVTALRINVTAVSGGGGTVSLGEIDVPVACITSSCVVTYVSLPAAIVLAYYSAQNIVINGSPPSVYRQPNGTFFVESGQ